MPEDLQPGQSALQRIPLAAYSTVVARVRPMIAALDAQYAAVHVEVSPMSLLVWCSALNPGRAQDSNVQHSKSPTRPPTEVVLMIMPLVPVESTVCVRNWAIACLEPRNAPRAFTDLQDRMSILISARG